MVVENITLELSRKRIEELVLKSKEGFVVLDKKDKFPISEDIIAIYKLSNKMSPIYKLCIIDKNVGMVLSQESFDGFLKRAKESIANLEKMPYVLQFKGFVYYSPYSLKSSNRGDLIGLHHMKDDINIITDRLVRLTSLDGKYNLIFDCKEGVKKEIRNAVEYNSCMFEHRRTVTYETSLLTGEMSELACREKRCQYCV